MYYCCCLLCDEGPVRYHTPVFRRQQQLRILVRSTCVRALSLDCCAVDGRRIYWLWTDINSRLLYSTEKNRVSMPRRAELEASRRELSKKQLVCFVSSGTLCVVEYRYSGFHNRSRECGMLRY